MRDNPKMRLGGLRFPGGNGRRRSTTRGRTSGRRARTCSGGARGSWSSRCRRAGPAGGGRTWPWGCRGARLVRRRRTRLGRRVRGRFRRRLQLVDRLCGRLRPCRGFRSGLRGRFRSGRLLVGVMLLRRPGGRRRPGGWVRRTSGLGSGSQCDDYVDSPRRWLGCCRLHQRRGRGRCA